MTAWYCDPAAAAAEEDDDDDSYSGAT